MTRDHSRSFTATPFVFLCVPLCSFVSFVVHFLLPSAMGFAFPITRDYGDYVRLHDSRSFAANLPLCPLWFVFSVSAGEICSPVTPSLDLSITRFSAHPENLRL